MTIYNLVTVTLSSDCNDADERENLSQTKEKIEDIIKQALNSAFAIENSEKMSTWVKQEEQKIVKLKTDLQKINSMHVEKHEKEKTIDDGLYFPHV